MTEQLYYADPYIKEFNAVVLSVSGIQDGKYAVVLDRTAFYPEGGGQPGDRGQIDDVQVIDTQLINDEIVHITRATLKTGASVNCRIDWDRRFDLMQQHTGEHIISGIICSSLNCDNIGFHLGEESVTIDYNKYADVSKIKEIEELANRYIAEDHKAVIFTPDNEELNKITYRSKKALDSNVRIVSFPGADTCACCGTHLSSSAQVLMIKVISHKRFHEGIRLEILCGNRAVRHMLECWDQNSEIAKSLSVPPGKTFEAVERLLDQCDDLKLQINRYEEEVYSLISDRFINEGNIYIIRDEMDTVSLRRLCDSIYSKCSGFCIVFSGKESVYRYALMAKEDCFDSLLKSINVNLNGRGGGRDGLAQGSVNADKDSIEQFMKTII